MGMLVGEPQFVPAIAMQPKIVMVSAYGREDVMHMAERAGVDGFVVKPVSPSSLLDGMLSALGRGRILGAVEDTAVSAVREAGS